MSVNFDSINIYILSLLSAGLQFLTVFFLFLFLSLSAFIISEAYNNYYKEKVEGNPRYVFRFLLLFLIPPILICILIYSLIFVNPAWLEIALLLYAIFSYIFFCALSGKSKHKKISLCIALSGAYLICSGLMFYIVSYFLKDFYFHTVGKFIFTIVCVLLTAAFSLIIGTDDIQETTKKNTVTPIIFLILVFFVSFFSGIHLTSLALNSTEFLPSNQHSELTLTVEGVNYVNALLQTKYQTKNGYFVLRNKCNAPKKFFIHSDAGSDLLVSMPDIHHKYHQFLLDANQARLSSAEC